MGFIVSRIQQGRASTVVDTIDRIWKNMGVDQNLLSQLHPILYRLLFKYLVFIDVQSQNLQEVW